MVDEPPTIQESRLPTQGRSPGELAREALSLAAILTVSLGVSWLERIGVIPVQGYPSSLLLAGLCLVHWKYFAPGLPLFTVPGPLRLCRAILPGAMILGILLSAVWLEVPSSGSPATSPQLFHLIVIVPLSEELYFRGLLLNHLRSGFSPITATIFCTSLFGLLHWPAGTMLVATLISIVGCVLVFRGGSLVYAMQLHVTWNAVSQIHRIEDDSLRWVWAGVAVTTVVILTLGLFWKKTTHDATG